MFYEEKEKKRLTPEDIDHMDIHELEALIRERFPDDWGLNTSLELYKHGGKSTIKLRNGQKVKIEPHRPIYLQGIKKRLKLLLFGSSQPPGGMYQ